MLKINLGYLAGFALIIGGLLFINSTFFISLIPIVIGFGLIIYINRRAPGLKQAARAHRRPTCAGDDLRLIQYLGWNGTIHSFDIIPQKYALAFMRMNRSKLVNVPIETMRLLEQEGG